MNYFIWKDGETVETDSGIQHGCPTQLKLGVKETSGAATKH
jgi:hypothetical protein